MKCEKEYESSKIKMWHVLFYLLAFVLASWNKEKSQVSVLEFLSFKIHLSSNDLTNVDREAQRVTRSDIRVAGAEDTVV